MLSGLLTLVVRATQTDYRKDLDVLISALGEYGAYTRADSIDLKAVSARYRSKLENAQSRDEALTVFESVMGELHDFHASLNTNNQSSPRLVPSGADIIASWRGDHAFVDQIRDGSPAESAGVRFGDEIIEMQGKPVRLAARGWLSGEKNSLRAWNWGLNSVLAGRWNEPRNLVVRRKGQTHRFDLPTFKETKAPGRVLTVSQLPNGIVSLRPENTLGEDDLVRSFDAAVPVLRKAKGVILDLRNTPSGGNSNVARGMMGLFISKRLPFQRHRVEEASTKTVRDWVEYATPRLTSPIKCPMVVLVGRWTSSMGEGIAIGFDAMHRATVVGTPMAGLRGAVDGIDLPIMGCRAYFPTEQVFHINGAPRHDWVPPVSVTPTDGEAWIKKALSVLKQKQ